MYYKHQDVHSSTKIGYGHVRGHEQHTFTQAQLNSDDMYVHSSVFLSRTARWRRAYGLAQTHEPKKSTDIITQLNTFSCLLEVLGVPCGTRIRLYKQMRLRRSLFVWGPIQTVTRAKMPCCTSYSEKHSLYRQLSRLPSLHESCFYTKLIRSVCWEVNQC